MFSKGLKALLKKGRGSGKKELHLQRFGNPFTRKSPTITCAFTLRAALGGTDRPVHHCVHSGDKALASQVSSWERGKLRCFRGGGRAQLGNEAGRRKWGRAGEIPELQAIRCYSWLGSRERFTPNDSHTPRGKPPKPRSLCILPEVTMKSGGRVPR